VQFAPQQPVPVFPLPGGVLFPHTLLPLHVFELRYRTMVRDALSGARMIGLAMLAPGWERDYRGSPPFHPIGCLARFEEVEWLPNDCYDLKLLGLMRVRFDRTVRDYPYRACRVQPLPQAPHGEDDPLVMLERRALLDAYARMARRHEAEGSPPLTIGEGLSFESVVNAVCMAIAAPPSEKMMLLELDSVVERSRRAREWLESRLRRPAIGPVSGGEHN
jgi:Lon protease-like protein